MNLREPKFPECLDCKFYHPDRDSSRCIPCGNGEYFEEKVEPRELDDDEAMRFFAKSMNRERDDDE
jgi:hypothetical protein